MPKFYKYLFNIKRSIKGGKNNYMKYSLASNAMSSLHIAIEHFKVFFYKRSGLSQSIVDENIKISLTFLENAIELLLKTILVVGDETSIYVEPNSKAIKRAKSKKSTKESLSDILIKTENVKTITYTETLEIITYFINQISYIIFCIV